MSSLLSKLKKNSKIDQTDVLDKSELFNDKDMIPTDIPMLNVALSGSLDGGLTSGLTVLAGPSKHFKSSYSLIMASAYLKKYPEAVMLFYDSEFGSPQQYFKTFGIDPSRVLHTPVTNVEELKFDLVNQLNGLERGEKVIVIIDSIGNLASKKEVEDAMNEKSVADMSRAKALKGLFRMVTPYRLSRTSRSWPSITATRRSRCTPRTSCPAVPVSTIQPTLSGCLVASRTRMTMVCMAITS